MTFLIVYSVIIMAVGILLLMIGIFLFIGKLGLLHEYHRGSVKEEDKKSYGHAVGIPLSLEGLCMLAIGILTVVLKTSFSILISSAIIIVSLLLTIFVLLIVIKIYNGKIFD